MAETLDELLNRVEKKETVVEPTGEKKAEEVVVEKVVVIETPEEVVIPTGAEDEPKEFLSVLENTKPVEEKKAVEIPAEFLEEMEGYKSKLNAYENDPLYKAVSLGATRDELLSIAAELNGKDFSKTSFRDLLTSDIKEQSGLEGQELEEAVESTLLEHSELRDWQQKARENQLRKQFEATAKKGESPTLAALDSAYAEKVKGIKTPEMFEQEMRQTATLEKQAILELGSKLVGSKMYGVEFTNDMLKDIVEKDYDVQNIDKEFLDAKGDLMIGDFIQKKFTSRSLPNMIAWAKEEGAREANKGSAHVKGQVRQTNVATNMIDPKDQELKDLGLGNILDKPKSIQWKE